MACRLGIRMGVVGWATKVRVGGSTGVLVTKVWLVVVCEDGFTNAKAC